MGTIHFVFLVCCAFIVLSTAFPTSLNKQSVPLEKTILKRYPISLPESYAHLGPELSVKNALPNVNLDERQDSAYWYETAEHGISAFGPPGYVVFRNVKDYGAMGDGSTDDTAAINSAITAGNRCGETCGSSSILPAVVYFPEGTYIVSAPLIQYYNTQFVGNPNAVPTLKAAAGFSGIAVIDSNVYIPGGSGAQWYVPQSNFYRQVRNFIIDISACPNSTPDGFAPTGIHWQVAQATSLQNIEFTMSQAAGTTHVGIFMENGSGGFVGDLTFTGGAIGMNIGSQQFTSRNLAFTNCGQAIQMIWDWGWTFQGLNVLLCNIGVNVSSGYAATAMYRQGVAAVAILDSTFTNVPIVVLTDGTTNTMLENVQLNNAPIAIGYSGGPTVLSGGDLLIDNYGQGNNFIQNGDDLTESVLGGPYDPSAKSAAPASLRTSTGWFSRSKPQYNDISLGAFISVKDHGAAGDGATDDTAAINSALSTAASGDAVLYFPHGSYIVTDTISIPPGSRIVGEIWSEIMGTGPNFADISNPTVMVQVGTSGSTGLVEISDMLFTVQGATAGAILMEWNIAASSQGAAAMWDSHFRVGGAQGSQLQNAQCPSSNPNVDPNCIAATMLMHITSEGNAYLENVWIWTADHDLDLPSQAQVSIYTARAFLVESQGPTWLWGTAAEHSALYQYHFDHAENIFAATETPYYQPSPKAPLPFTGTPAYPSDPTFTYCSDDSSTCAYAWGLEIVSSSNMMIYGAGFYSWFQWYSQICLNIDECQERITRVIESNNIFIVNLYTKGSYSMIQGSSTDDVIAAQNKDGFLAEIVGWTGLNVEGSTDSPSTVVLLPPWIWSVPSPTVYCEIPCVIQPPPTPIFPIQPPPYTTTISGSPVIVTPPPIDSPVISVQSVSITANSVTVTPAVVPSPSVVVPPVAPSGNFPGDPEPIIPPPIPIPIPPSFIPGACIEFCGPGDWPPVLPPIVVDNGPPIPYSSDPPAGDNPDDPDGDGADEGDEPDDDDNDELTCVPLLNIQLPSYPSPSDIPSWGQSSGTTTTTSGCSWTLGQLPYTTTVSISGTSFTVDVFGTLEIGPSYGISVSGMAIQAYAVQVLSWATTNTPSSAGASSDTNFIDFDIPTNPLATDITLQGTVPSGTSSIQLTFTVAATVACGGQAIPDPPSTGPLPPEFPSEDDGTIDCASNAAAGVDMADCTTFNYGDFIVQGAVISETSTITTENPSTNCVRNGVSSNSEEELSNWCIVAQYQSCAFVIADKLPSFGGFPGYSVISGEVMRNFAIGGANQCAGNERTAIAAGPFQPFGVAAQTLCLVSPDHPEICAVR